MCGGGGVVGFLGVAKFVDLNSKRSPASMAEKKKTKILDMYDFPVQDCTQELNSTPYVSSGRQLCQGRLLRSRNFVTMAM